jgi:uncharacterized protein (DUF1501 family)
MTQSPLLPTLFLLASFPAFADGGQNSCVRWANDIVEGTADGCDELCPQAQQYDNYDYRAGLNAAFESRSGLSAYFEYLDRLSIIGSAAEAQGRAAVIANVGALLRPLSIAQYFAHQNDRAWVPAHLHSHSDQQAFWMTGMIEGQASDGYGGRLASVLASANQYPGLTSLSTSFAAPFLRRSATAQVLFNEVGVPTVSAHAAPQLFGSSGGAAAAIALMSEERTHLFEKDYQAINRNARQIATVLNGAMSGSAAVNSAVASIPDSTMGRQLRSVVRSIAANQAVGARRQIYFVWDGAFDMHSDLVQAHGPKWADMSTCIARFDAAMVSLGLSDQVTLFTASDFGRSLKSNGDGCDHGWGAHHFVVGGRVLGGRVYGTWPEVALGGSNDVGDGILLPTLSTDQHFATLAKWMGVSPAQMPSVVPRIGEWATPDLGYLLA